MCVWVFSFCDIISCLRFVLWLLLLGIIFDVMFEIAVQLVAAQDVKFVARDWWVLLLYFSSDLYCSCCCGLSHKYLERSEMGNSWATKCVYLLCVWHQNAANDKVQSKSALQVRPPSERVYIEYGYINSYVQIEIYICVCLTQQQTPSLLPTPTLH